MTSEALDSPTYCICIVQYAAHKWHYESGGKGSLKLNSQSVGKSFIPVSNVFGYLAIFQQDNLHNNSLWRMLWAAIKIYCKLGRVHSVEWRSPATM